jgi:hypothetical protein
MRLGSRGEAGLVRKSGSKRESCLWSERKTTLLVTARVLAQGLLLAGDQVSVCAGGERPPGKTVKQNHRCSLGGAACWLGGLLLAMIPGVCFPRVEPAGYGGAAVGGLGRRRGRDARLQC